MMFLLNKKIDVIAFGCLQHCGIGLEFNFFDIVGTLTTYDSSSVKHVCSSCNVNPNFTVLCEFVNQLLQCVRIRMDQNSHDMPLILKACIGFYDNLSGVTSYEAVMLTILSSTYFIVIMHCFSSCCEQESMCKPIY